MLYYDVILAMNMPKHRAPAKPRFVKRARLFSAFPWDIREVVMQCAKLNLVDFFA